LHSSVKSLSSLTGPNPAVSNSKSCHTAEEDRVGFCTVICIQGTCPRNATSQLRTSTIYC